MPKLMIRHSPNFWAKWPLYDYPGGNPSIYSLAWLSNPDTDTRLHAPARDVAH